MIHLFVSDVSPMPNRLDGAANAQRARHAQELRSELDSHSHCALMVLQLHILESRQTTSQFQRSTSFGCS